MIKILFICHGNICRSPMAEIVMRNMVEQHGLASQIEVDSAAVSSEELGNPVYPQAQRELQRRGLPRSDHRAWRISHADYGRFDYFVCMDRDNLYRMQSIFGGDPQGKCAMLLSYTDRSREVEDPWYTGRFDHVFEDIEEGCEALLTWLIGHSQG